MTIKKVANWSVLIMCLSTSQVYAGEGVTEKIQPEKITHGVTSTAFVVGVNPEPAVCAIEDNGQDWKALQGQFTQQLKTNTRQAKLNQLTRKNQSIQTVIPEGADAVAGRYYIPVVFHVYGAQFNCEVGQECLTEQKISDALRATNEDFQGLNTQDGPIAPEFQAIRENLDVEFVLAKVDPNGNPTNGIVRHDREQIGYGEGSQHQDEIAADSWDNFKYMNIYIMNKLYDDGATNNSGVAWYPELAMSERGTARVVYNGWYVGSNTNENFRSVLTHEFGHWLNLPHVFEDKACGLSREAFCTLTGDGICDTPQMNSSSLKSNAKNCVGQPTNTENFMHYTDNYAMYTQQQVQRMVAALQGSARNTIWSNDNLVATGLANYVSNAPHEWDGSGADLLPPGHILLDITNLSAEKDEVDTYMVDFPLGTEAGIFYLDGYLRDIDEPNAQDPDMYVSKGVAPEPLLDGNWDAEYISFKSSGTPEFIGLLEPSSEQPYYAAIHAYDRYDNARLRVLAADDPTLCDGCKRVYIHDEKELSGKLNDNDKKYQFKIPKAASRVVLVMENGYSGDPDLLVGLNKAPITDAADSIATETDCVPFASAGSTEFCQFNRGGRFNVQIDPYADYSGASLKVFYEILKGANYDPLAVIVTKANALTGKTASFSSEGSEDNDGYIENYLWNFGDDSASDEVNPEHIFANAGEYTVTLTVTDDLGETDTVSQIIVVTDPLLGDWNFDGQVDSNDLRALMRALQFQEEISLSFDLNGDGRVTMLDVREMNALCSYYRCSTTPPPPKPPVAEANGTYYGVVASVINFSAQGSTDPDSSIVSYHWDFGDDAISWEMNPSHIYLSSGEYQVTLTVTDDSGLTSSDTAQVVVTLPEAPVLPDVCADTAVFTGRDLTAGVPVCLTQSENRIALTVANVKGHSSIAITIAHGTGDAKLIYKTGSWPNDNTNDGSSDNSGNNECIYIDNLSPEMNYWGYMYVSGNGAGASLAVDFDTAGCRNTQ